MRERLYASPLARCCIIILSFFLVFVIGLFYFCHTAWNEHPNAVLRLSPEWSHRPPISQQGQISLFYQLPNMGDEAQLMLFTDHQNMRVYLNEKIFYVSPAPVHTKNPGIALYKLSLPSDYVGSSLHLQLSSPYSTYAGKTPKVYLGEAEAFETMNLLHSIPSLTITILMITSGLIALLVSSHRLFEKKGQGAGLLLGILFILWGLYASSESSLAFQLFSPHWMSLNSIGLYLLYPLFAFAYIASQFKRKRFMMPGLILQLLFVLLAFFLQVTGICDFPQLLLPLNIIYLFQALSFLFVGVLELLDQNPFLRFLFPWLLIAVFCSTLTLLYFYFFNDDSFSILYLASVFLLLLSMNYYQLRRFFREYQREVEEWQMLQLKNQLIMESLERQREQKLQVQVLLHEVDHQLAVLQIYLEQNKINKAKDYLTSLLAQSQGGSGLTYCANPLLDSLLGNSFSKAESLGVSVRCNIQLPEALKLPENDLCSLLLNLLDNALDACQSIPDGKSRWLRLDMRMEEPYLFVCCENARHGPLANENGVFLSTKHNRKNQGLGLGIVSNLVERHNGMLKISHSSNSFRVIALLRTDADYPQ